MANLLANGAVMGMCLQPHESHLPFLLQFKVGRGGGLLGGSCLGWPMGH